MQKIYASRDDQTIIDSEGDWQGKTDSEGRSIFRIPIYIYTDGRFIYIQNADPYCDVTVTIRNSQTDAMEYEETFPEAATSSMVISIEDLSVGTYTLELTNPYGGHLTGIFCK